MRDGDRLLAYRDGVPGSDVVIDERLLDDRLQVVAGCDQRRANRDARVGRVAGVREQVAARVGRARRDEARGFVGPDRARGELVAVACERRKRLLPKVATRAIAEVHAQPELDVDRAPEEHRIVDLPVARAPECVGDGEPVPVGSRAERGGAVEALDDRAPRAQPPHLRGREPHLPPAGPDLLGERLAQALSEDRAAPAIADDRARRETEHPLDELLVEERDPRLDRVRHRVAVFVAQQRRQAVRGEVLQEPFLQIRLRALVLRGLPRRQVLVAEEASLVERFPALGEPPLDQRLEHVARGPRFAGECSETPLAQQLLQVHVVVRHVSGEQLVAGLSVEKHLHLRRREPHDAPLRVRPRRDDRLLGVPHELLDLVEEDLRRGVDVVLLRAGRFELGFDVLALVDRVPVEHRGERLQPVAERDRVGNVIFELLRHRRDDRRRVQASGQTRSDRHVRDQSPLHGPLEQAPELGRVRPRVGSERGRPVGVFADTARVDLDVRRRAHLVDALEEGAAGVVVQAPDQVLVQELLVRLGVERPVLQDRLDLRCEQDPLAGARPMQRLYAEVVAREHEPRRLAKIEDPDRPHTVEAREALRPPLLVRVHDGLGIGVGLERVAGRLELRAQLAEVVDLTVEDDLHAPVLVAHRLRSVREVDDRQAAKSQARVLGFEEALVVRTAMLLHAGHRFEQPSIGRSPEARDATHGNTSTVG